MRTLVDALDRRVLLMDGAIAPQLRGLDLDPERDLFGAPDCTEILALTRAACVRSLHETYLRAGADVIHPHSVGASPLALRRFGLAEHAFAINYAAAQLACAAVDAVPGHGRRRFVLGVIEDFGWKASAEELESAVAVQVEALMAGGVDGVALKLAPDSDRLRPFLRGAFVARESARTTASVFFVSGQIRAKYSSEYRRLVDGIITYREGKAEDGGWLSEAIQRHQANLVGGGETPAETAELDKSLRAKAEDGLRPLVAWAVRPAFDEAVPPSSLLHFDSEASDPAIVDFAEFAATTVQETNGKSHRLGRKGPSGRKKPAAKPRVLARP